MTDSPNILVIKHGALGDMVLATAAFAAIRAHHPLAQITLLTTRAYAELMAQSPFFDEIWIDRKPKWLDRGAIKRLADMLNSKRWQWVYDLQTSTRTTLYQWLLGRPWPSISNASRWVSHPRGEYNTQIHALENIRQQLAKTGITVGDSPDISWLEADVSEILALIGSARTVPMQAALNPFALLVPGGAAHRPAKRWPAEQYASLAQELSQRAIRPVLVGTEAEKEALEAIAQRVPGALNLCGKTSIAQLATLARQAKLAVGNDTGPMHVIAAAGCPSLVLFSGESDPVRSVPKGPKVAVLREKDLRDLTVDRVLVGLTALA